MTTDDIETATAALRDLLAETEATRRHGISLDGYRSPATRAVCDAVADAMLPLFTADWHYGVVWDPAKPGEIFECDDQEHARDWKRDLHGSGPVVRMLAVRLGGQTWQPVPEEPDHG
ncbi:hypothetical protein BDK92_7149 [Micromonospora pisi]|uniref:Uncharacterized protein n=1 Tax=Micromonospora pisi TaxID=589240 RepID=A0A495JUL2_9ACTN|nr:hypothetical protein [Micromonospora pisi]RKR92673.1 hypothetical protein BDK92_7149 [Micromonospora pisi]